MEWRTAVTIRRWHWKDSDAPRPDGFVAVDPGRDGAFAIFSLLSPDPIIVVPTAEEPSTLASYMLAHRVSTMVLETQFMGANVMSALELTASAWMLVGWVGCRIGSLDVIECAPATWQAAQRKRMGIEGRLLRADGIKLALDEASPWSTAYTKKKAEGVASAIGIGRSFLGLYGAKPEDPAEDETEVA